MAGRGARAAALVLRRRCTGAQRPLAGTAARSEANRQPLRRQRRAASATAAAVPAASSGPRLTWDDATVAAHITQVVLPRLVEQRTPPLAAAEALRAELAELGGLGCTVWAASWTAALRHFARRSVFGSAAAREEAAQTLFNACVESGVDPDRSTYEALIAALRTYKNRRIAFDFMVLDGTEPTESIVHSVLALCFRHPRTGRHKAESLFAFLDHECLAPSLSLWNCLMSIYTGAKDLAGASDVYLRMRHASCRGNSETYRIFVTACSAHVKQQGDEAFVLAEQAFSQAAADGTELDTRAHCALLRVYAAAGHHRRSRALLARMRDAFSYVPSEALLQHRRALLRGGGSRAEAQAVLRSVRRRFLRALPMWPKAYKARFEEARARWRRSARPARTPQRGEGAKRRERGDPVARAMAIKGVSLMRRGWALKAFRTNQPGSGALPRAAQPPAEQRGDAGGEDEDAEDSDALVTPPPGGAQSLDSEFEGKLRAVSRTTVRIGAA